MNKKGMTLIEIVVSVAILLIMATIFLTTMSSYFGFLSKGRGMTEDIFEGQEKIEKNIEAIKSAIFNEEEVESDKGTLIEYDLFEGEWAERKVEAYRTEIEIPVNRNLVTLVGSEQIKYPVPVAENINLKIRINDIEQPDNYEYVTKPNLSLKGTFDIEDPEGVYLTTRHEWFVSRIGFSIPIEKDTDFIEEPDVGRLYPVFPNDYSLIPINAHTSEYKYSNLAAIEEEYTNRHIIYTVSPYALSGKKGETKFSQPVFLHGPTITDDLVLHLDASMISKDDKYSDIEYLGEDILVNTWNDLSGTNNDADTISSDKPILNETQYQDDTYVWGKSIIQNSSNSTNLRISSFNDSPTSEMTFILVAKILGTNTNTNIISGNEWGFGWNNEGNLAYRVGGDYSGAAFAPSGKGIDDKWHIFTGKVSGGNIFFRIDTDPQEEGTVNASLNTSQLYINLEDVEIAEILMYNDDLDSDDLDEVEAQLINKYDPDPAEITTDILYIKSIPDKTVIKNSPFNPPVTVEAVMTNGTTQQVFVNWNDTVDTSIIGSKTIRATASIDSTKSVNMTVHVVGIDTIEHHENPLIVEKGVSQTLPSTLTAILTNGQERLIQVIWTSNEPNISIDGNTLTGNSTGTYNNAIRATAKDDSDKFINYNVKVEKSYVVNFVDYDNSLLKTQNVAEGDSAIAPPDPERVGHTFTDWDTDYTNVTSDLTVKAQYELNTYTVRFVDFDDSLIVQRSVQHGDEAYPPSPDPTRTGYTFTGWDKAFDNITSDLTVKAQYEPIFYTVRFVDHDDSLIIERSVQHGNDATAPTNPTRTGYTFTGWNRSFTNVTSDLTVKAQYDPITYTVRFVDYDDSLIIERFVQYGNNATPPADPTREGYIFTGWDTNFNNVTSNLTVKAQYEIAFYTVEFIDYNDVLIIERTVQHGYDATAPADPTRTGYTFSGWNRSFTNITSDLIVKAQYNPNQYTVTLNPGEYGVGGPTDKTVTFGEEYGTLEVPASSNNRRSFDGWYLDRNNKNDEINENTIVSIPNDHDIHAHWKSSCPFVYTFDGEKYNFEHESIPFAINKTLETTSHKGLQKLKLVDRGAYKIRIAEMLTEISYINGFRLMAVDYPSNEGIEGVYSDIYGVPHTIKNRINPISFSNSKGQDKLYEITTEGVFVNSNIDDYYDDKYLASFEAIFDKPEETGDIAKLIVKAQKTMLTTNLGEYYLDKINATENMWWIDEALSMPFIKNKFVDFMKVINLQIQVWDGKHWINQGEIKAGLHLLEEFLIPIDLSKLDSNDDILKVRLVSGVGLFEIDQLSIDYSINRFGKTKELDISSAKFKGTKNVKDILNGFNDESRVRMEQGDFIDLTFIAPPIEEGFKRGFIADIKGYYFMDPETVERKLFETGYKPDKFEDIIKRISEIAVNDIVESLKTLKWLNNLIDEVYMKPLEFKVKTIIKDNYLMDEFK